MPHRSKPQGTGLALYSFGMVIAQSCGSTSICTVLAPVTGRTDGSLRQRLREWTAAAAAKAGPQRQDRDGTTCCASLLRWVLTWWASEERRLALVLDASTVGTRCTILGVRIVYRRWALPIAWGIVPATGKGKWQPHWDALLTSLHGVIAPDWPVIGRADRGRYAQWL